MNHQEVVLLHYPQAFCGYRRGTNGGTVREGWYIFTSRRAWRRLQATQASSPELAWYLAAEGLRKPWTAFMQLVDVFPELDQATPESLSSAKPRAQRKTRNSVRSLGRLGKS